MSVPRVFHGDVVGTGKGRQTRLGLRIDHAAPGHDHRAWPSVVGIGLALGGYALAGAIVGGLIIGIGEKMGEFYWGPLVGGGIENWIAYVIALGFLMVRPQGLFGDKIIERI